MTINHAMNNNVLRVYAQRVGAFRPNARLYLFSAILTGAALGVYRLLFNFYVLSLGYDESLLGQLITTSSMTSLILALPMGYLGDFLGRKLSLIGGGAAAGVAILAMVIWPSREMFILMNVLLGAGQSLGAVSMSPFLVENSGEEERTYLFSLSQGLQTAAAFVGNWVGGYLPTWIAENQGVTATSSLAYAGALGIIGGFALLALLPMLWIHAPKLEKSQRAMFAPWQFAREHPALLAKIIAPMLITSIGAGLFMPFMNVFYRNVHNQPDPVIGALFAWGSLAMGLGIIISPPLADRMGKIQFVVITQLLSIPFLLLLGFSPWFWLSAAAFYVRLALMNMGGPVYNAYVMEHVDPTSRATVASLVSMAWNFGWAFSPSISGWMQVNYGFNPVFLSVIVLYSISTFFYWQFFWSSKPRSSVSAG